MLLRARLVALAILLLGLVVVTDAQAAPVYPPDTTLTPEPMPEVARPDYLDPLEDPTFGTRITRISDKAAFDSTSKALRHAYAKNQPWNADGSLIMLDYTYPAAVLDGRTYEFLRWVHQPSSAVWSNVNPNETIGTAAGANRLIRVGMQSDGDVTTIRKFREYDEINFGQGEGNLSNNDNYIALFGIKDGAADLFVYDLENDEIVSRRSLGKATVGDGKSTINNATMSQSGEYVVVQYNRPGTGKNQGIKVFDRDLNPVGQASKRGGTHYDVCYDAQGYEAVVVQADNSTAVVAARLDTGAKTTVLTADQMNDSIHISCRNTGRPGWAYLSEFSYGFVDEKPNYQEVFAVKLDGSGTVQRFAHEHHSRNKDYARQPHGVPNRDGSKVLWASDWDDGRTPVYAYVAEMATP